MKIGQRGFTIVELVVSIVLIGIVVGIVSGLFLSIQSTQRSTVHLEGATRSAQKQMESLRNNNFNNLVAGSTIDFTSELPDYLKNSSGTVAVTDASNELKRIDVTVIYYEGTVERQVKLSSLVGILGITQ